MNCVVGSNVGASDQKPDYEFNLWTKPDCAGTSYENRNRCAVVHKWLYCLLAYNYVIEEKWCCSAVLF